MKLSLALDWALLTRFAAQATADRAAARGARVLRFLGDRDCRRVTGADVRRMVSAMRETGLSGASCNRYLTVLSAVLEQDGVALPMPWQREGRGRQRWLTLDEVRLLAAACLPRKHGDAVSSLVLFLAETGMRLGEALALTWEDFDFTGTRTTARVRSSKNGDARSVPLTMNAVQASRTRLTANERGPWNGLSQSTVDHVFRSARDAVASTRGDREVVVHALRHTAASRLTKAGVPLPIVAAWLGHRDVRSTTRYTHADGEGLGKAAAALEADQ